MGSRMARPWLALAAALALGACYYPDGTVDPVGTAALGAGVGAAAGLAVGAAAARPAPVYVAPAPYYARPYYGRPYYYRRW